MAGFQGFFYGFWVFRFPIFSGGNTWHNDTQIAKAAPAMQPSGPPHLQCLVPKFSSIIPLNNFLPPENVESDRHSHGNWFTMAPGPFLPPELGNCAASSTSTVELHLVDLYGKLRHVSIPLILWVWFTPQKSNIDTKHEGVMLGINPMVSIAADS